jgi:hypothetical protein
VDASARPRRKLRPGCLRDDENEAGRRLGGVKRQMTSDAGY